MPDLHDELLRAYAEADRGCPRCEPDQNDTGGETGTGEGGEVDPCLAGSRPSRADGDGESGSRGIIIRCPICDHRVWMPGHPDSLCVGFQFYYGTCPECDRGLSISEPVQQTSNATHSSAGVSPVEPGRSGGSHTQAGAEPSPLLCGGQWRTIADTENGAGALFTTFCLCLMAAVVLLAIYALS